MNSELLEHILNILFSKLMPYTIPALLLFSAFLFSDRLIEFFHNSISRIKSSRW